MQIILEFSIKTCGIFRHLQSRERERPKVIDINIHIERTFFTFKMNSLAFKSRSFLTETISLHLPFSTPGRNFYLKNAFGIYYFSRRLSISLSLYSLSFLLTKSECGFVISGFLNLIKTCVP
jgi:hypothetical protein